MFLEQLRWLVFAYSAVTSNVMLVFYNPFECFQVFAGICEAGENSKFLVQIILMSDYLS